MRAQGFHPTPIAGDAPKSRGYLQLQRRCRAQGVGDLATPRASREFDVRIRCESSINLPKLQLFVFVALYIVTVNDDYSLVSVFSVHSLQAFKDVED